jgi:hypothetical protein
MGRNPKNKMLNFRLGEVAFLTFVTGFWTALSCHLLIVPEEGGYNTELSPSSLLVFSHFLIGPETGYTR